MPSRRRTRRRRVARARGSRPSRGTGAFSDSAGMTSSASAYRRSNPRRPAMATSPNIHRYSSAFLTTSQSHHGPRRAVLGVVLDLGGAERTPVRELGPDPFHDLAIRVEPSAGLRPVLRAQLASMRNRNRPQSDAGMNEAMWAQYSTYGLLRGEQEAIERRCVVLTQPREQRHVVRPREDVHRVDLQRRHAGDREVQLPHAGRRRARSRESLGGEGDAARLGGAQGGLHARKPSHGLRHRDVSVPDARRNA